MFKSILIPIDRSAPAQGAAMLGLALAQKLNSSVTIIHVLQQPPSRLLPGDAVALEGVLKEISDFLESWQKRAEALGIPCQTKLIDEHHEGTGQTIAHTAQSLGTDLIVIGTHGREGLSRLLLGSVAERVSRLATQPVMLVRNETANSLKSNPFEKLFVPVDGSDTSAIALGVAHELCRQLNASLEIAHVVPDLPIPLTDPVGAYAAFDYAGLGKALEESGREVLSKAVKNTTLSNVSSHLVLAAGRRLSAAILEAARDASSDMIVIGTHGRSGVDRLLLGSVAEGVIHHAEVPVLLVRSSAEVGTRS
jgi:nucleotide-binding universal stress UspA family protein